MRKYLSGRFGSALGRCLVFTAILASFGTASAQIQLAWTRSYPAERLAGFALDGLGNVCVAGTVEGDFVVTKFSPAGSLVWSNRYDGGSAEQGTALAADAAGHVWVSGVTDFTNGISQRAALTVKFNPDGSRAWVGRFHTNVYSVALNVDADGNGYVAGTLQSGPSEWSLYVVKYAANGELQWEREYAAGTDWYIAFGGLEIDGSSGITLAGLSTNTRDLSQRRNVLARFDFNGTLLWTNEALPYVGGGTPSGMAVDRDGRVFVAGNGLLASRFDADGTLDWTRTRTGPRPGFIFSNPKIDPAGNLMIAGTEVFSYKLCSDCGDYKHVYSLIPMKLNAAGEVLWPEMPLRDYGFGQWQFDADASCYLGGSYSTRSDDGLPPHADVVLAKYAPNGAELWRTNFTRGLLDGMKVNAEGDIFLVMGNYTLFEIQKYVQPQSLPVIRSQPEPRTILDGDSVGFSVAGSGFPSPVFQWSLNGVMLPGETNATLFLPSAHASQAGDYTVVLSNVLGAVTSATAALQVNFEAPVVTAHFTSGESPALLGTQVTLCAETTGGPKPSLQWDFNGVVLPGETNACLSLGPLQLDQSGSYRVTASNSQSATSAALDLSVLPILIQSPAGSTQNLAVGQCTTFLSSIGATPPFSLQWLRDGEAIPGQTNWYLGLCPVTINDAGQFAVVLMDSSGSYTSPPIALTVYFAPPTLAQPQFLLGGTSTFVGEDLTLYAGYAGSPSFVQWRLNGADLPGETNQTLVMLGVTSDQAGQYSFIATNIAGATTSGIVAITIDSQAPFFIVDPASQTVVEGNEARFAAQARGGPPPVYFLQHEGTNVAVPFAFGGCCPDNVGHFTLLDTTVADSGYYQIIASNSVGSVTSLVASLTVTPAGPLDRWTQRNPLPQSQPLLALAHSSSQFVAVGARGTILTSPDGVNWAVQSRRADVPLNGVAHGGGMFVAVGENGTILSSSDGTNWAYRYTAPFTSLNAITYGGGRFVAVGAAPGIGTLVFRSEDGIQWERVALGSHQAQQSVTYGAAGFVAAGSSSIIVSADGANWTLVHSGVLTIESLAFAGGQYVAVGDNGLILVSVDGVSWDSRLPATSRRLLGVTQGAGVFVAAGARGTMLTSHDAIEWTAVASGTPDRLETLDFAEGLFIAAGENGTMITSTNGVDWTRRNFGVTRDLDGMAVANGMIAIVGKGGSILTSVDGAHYFGQDSRVTNDLHGIAWGGGLWVAVGEPGIVLTSPDATNWTTRATGNTNSLKGVSYADGTWIVVGTQGTVVRSTDGVRWESSYTNPPYDLNDVAFGNGMILAVGDGPRNQDGSIFKSSDGIAFEQLLVYPGKNLRGLTFADGVFLFAANDGVIMTSADGTNLEYAASGNGNLRAAVMARGLWTVVGNQGTILTSTDRISWTRRASRTFENLHEVVMLDGTLVAIGNRGTILQSERFIAELEPPQISGDIARIPFKGVWNQPYQLEASTDLVTWAPVLTFTNASNAVLLDEAGANSHGRRFYRVVAP